MPNILTALRILLIPLEAYLLFKEQYVPAAAVFLFACLTDVLDGYIARRYSLVTEIGTLLDPLADKGMQLTVLVLLAVARRIPPFAVWIIAVKEIVMFFGGLFLYRRDVVVASNWYGKTATVLISACVAALILLYDRMTPGVRICVQWLPALAALVAVVLYGIHFRKIVQDRKLL